MDFSYFCHFLPNSKLELVCTRQATLNTPNKTNAGSTNQLAYPLVSSARSQLMKTPQGALCMDQQPKFCGSHNCCCPHCDGAAWKWVPREPKAARALSKFSVPAETC